MPFGLPDTTLAQIQACLAQYPQITWVKLYGSRAMGTFSPGSDIDLAYSGPETLQGPLMTALDDLPTPYLFDVTAYDTLQNPDLKAHIDRVGHVIYPASE